MQSNVDCDGYFFGNRNRWCGVGQFGIHTGNFADRFMASRAVLNRWALRVGIASFVACNCLLAWIYAGQILPRKAGYVNGTIHFIPQCAWLAKAIFVPGYVPTFKEFERIRNELDRCNEQGGSYPNK